MRASRLALLGVVLLVSGCALRWMGRDTLVVDPLFDWWAQHPETVQTNQPAR